MLAELHFFCVTGLVPLCVVAFHIQMLLHLLIFIASCLEDRNAGVEGLGVGHICFGHLVCFLAHPQLNIFCGAPNKKRHDFLSHEI